MTLGRFVYDDTSNRAVAVHSAAIVHALRAIYGAGALADELETAKQRACRDIQRIHCLASYYRTDIGDSLWPPGSN
jgi:phosphoribosylamine-glycine ligase